MTEFWEKPAEKSGKVLAAFLEGLPLVYAPAKRAETFSLFPLSPSLLCGGGGTLVNIYISLRVMIDTEGPVS